MSNFDTIREDVINGIADPLIALAQLKQEKDYLESVISEIQDIALDESLKYDKKFTLHGYSFERRGGATRYSFNHIPEWQELNNKVKDYESVVKSAFINKGKNMNTITEDGEELPFPKVTTGKDILIIKKQ